MNSSLSFCCFAEPVSLGMRSELRASFGQNYDLYPVDAWLLARKRSPENHRRGTPLKMNMYTADASLARCLTWCSVDCDPPASSRALCWCCRYCQTIAAPNSCDSPDVKPRSSLWVSVLRPTGTAHGRRKEGTAKLPSWCSLGSRERSTWLQCRHVDLCVHARLALRFAVRHSACSALFMYVGVCVYVCRCM